MALDGVQSIKGEMVGAARRNCRATRAIGREGVPVGDNLGHSGHTVLVLGCLDVRLLSTQHKSAKWKSGNEHSRWVGISLQCV